MSQCQSVVCEELFQFHWVAALLDGMKLPIRVKQTTELHKQAAEEDVKILRVESGAKQNLATSEGIKSLQTMRKDQAHRRLHDLL